MLASSKHSDFGDWLSPMVVKELRQGMRSRIFVAAFYLTQLLMILSTVFGLIAASRTENVPSDLFGFLSGLFWFMVSVPLLFVMPLLGFGALHTEMKAGTLELVFLTRLSAWRIVAGKWTALMAETLLLVCAILPYVILRYFLGGVNIIEDLQSLFFLLLASALLTAATLAMSPYRVQTAARAFHHWPHLRFSVPDWYPFHLGSLCPDWRFIQLYPSGMADLPGASRLGPSLHRSGSRNCGLAHRTSG